MKKFIAVSILAVLVLSMASQVMATGSEPDEADIENPADFIDLPIVMYHHISPKSKLWGEYVISPDQFERDMSYLKEQGYTSITSEELIAWYDGTGELPEKPVMITFDDGYESTEAYALPILEKYGFTAVVAVIGSVAQQYTDLPDHMLDYSHMSWEMIAELDAGDVLEIQCHSYNMHKLGARRGCSRKYGESDEDYWESLGGDLGKFQYNFKQYTGHKCSVLVLPFGVYTETTIEIAKAMGFRAVFTCSERVNHLAGDVEELYNLGRYNRPSGISSESFFAKWKLG